MTTTAEPCEARLDTYTAGDIKKRPNTSYRPLAEKKGYFMAVCALPSALLRRQIKIVSERIQRKFPNHYFVPESYSHITIANIGVVATADEVRSFYEQHNDTLRNISGNNPSFKIIVESVGHFANCCFVQVCDESDTLDTLHESLVSASGMPDAFPFAPHSTIAYNGGDPNPRNRYIDEHLADIDIGSDIVDTVHLTALDARRGIYETPYEIVESYPLNT